MTERRLRVLTISSHPIQYGAPLFRIMAAHPKLDYQVAYCSLRGAEAGYDPEFGAHVQWDVPLLDGYKWTHIPNRGSGAEGFWDWRNTGLWKFIRQGKFDVVISHVGYVRATFWIAYFAARSVGIPFLFGTDASNIEPRDESNLKLTVKRVLWPAVFGLSGQVLTASSAGRDMMVSLGFPADRVSMTLDTVDNDWWFAQASAVDRDLARRSLGFLPNEKAILFCAKLQSWKRPMDLLRAFASAAIPDAKLVFAGDGAQRAELETEAAARGIQNKVEFLGFVNQSQLPRLYKAADLMVIPSRYEPFGLVVNESMLCGCPVIASDRVGAVRDLITHGETGYVYSCGDVESLASTIRQAVEDPVRLNAIRTNALERIRAWSPQASAEALVSALESAVSRRRPGSRAVAVSSETYT
ncbi:MAG TPA: glycosyltransferase family 4 protein [Candidatus Sulfotelmatobacter sp.]|nr:glycosyltransferase family 4 protein [Candidatus Sulfotelmatobacter sp.]